MPGSAIGTQMLIGFPGTYARSGDCVISAKTAKTTAPSFGDPVILNTDNTVTKGGATLAMTNFLGVAVREVKTPSAWPPSSSVGAYAVGDLVDVIERGSVAVVCNVGTPTSGGKVYVRVTANGGVPAGVVGGFEASADGGNTVEITNAKWTTGSMDANNVAEITLIGRNFRSA